MLLSIAKDLKDFRPIQAQSMAEVAEIVTSGFNWSCSTFKDNQRLKDHFLGTDLIALDIDSDCSLEDAKIRFSEYCHVLALTKSHQLEKNGLICDRFRVILKLSSRIESNEIYDATWHSLYVQFPFIDPACKDSSRFFFSSPLAVNVVETGLLVDPAPLPVPVSPTLAYGFDSTKDSLTQEQKGRLAKSTLEFLILGAEPGSWNRLLFKAAKDWQEQGYSEEEFRERAELITGYLDHSDKNTIDSAFKREPKYEPRLDDIILDSDIQDDFVLLPKDLIQKSVDYLADKNLVSGQTTGFKELDKLLGGGLRTGELMVVHALTKAGKSSFIHSMMLRMMNQDLPIGFCSRELSPDREVIPNFLSMALKHNVWKADITEASEKVYASEIARWPLFFCKGFGYIDPQDLRTWILKLKNDYGVKYFFLDHLHQMISEPEEHKEASKLVKVIKTLAIEENIAIVLIVQANRMQDGQRLSINSLKGGAAIAQALDCLINLEREPEQKDITRVSLSVARHKLASPGYFYLQYDRETTDFSEVFPEETPAVSEFEDNVVSFKTLKSI